MFILIPSIIIFLAFSYLQLSEDVTLLEEVIVYTIIVFTILISLKLYKAIKKDMKQQKINGILFDIKELEAKLKKEEDKKTKEFLSKKIEKLKGEILP